MQVTSDTTTLGLMVWASTLNPLDTSEKQTIDIIYLCCMLIQVYAVFPRRGLFFVFIRWAGVL